MTDPELPHYARVFYVNRGRWPGDDEMCFEHQWLEDAAGAVLDKGGEAAARGESRTALAALHAEFEQLMAELEVSHAYLADLAKRRDREAIANYPKMKAREVRWARLLRQAYGYLPD